ncbi:hypothetical protein FH972_024407 [Carpinus fangiana]|uniref:NADP-dependent oxidoreductase domain-containing protein n=1 Tax=Carpinus fangiana TaxID=176857 RepID=A0A5N6KYB6_9ROSI|nr:hypothetical protein FH972_024407 [Carpinus fangiana]
MKSKIPTIELRDGQKMPLLAFGTGTAWYKDDGKGPFNKELKNMLKHALDTGIRHIDAAEAYGTEEEIGVAIRESGVDRQELFVTTKVQQGISDIPRAFEESLAKLQLDYVDLYMIHWPYFAEEDAELQRAWNALEAIYKQGRAKAIGVANYLRPHIEATLKTATIVPMVNQIEHHPYLQRANDYVPWLQSQGIRMEAFSPLTPITEAQDGPLSSHLMKIAAKHNVSTGAVLLRWQIQKDIVAITTTTKKERLEDYMKVGSFALTAEEMKLITEVGLTYHYRSWGVKRFAPDDRT